MAVSVQANTPLADQLSNIVQPKLVEVGWSTGDSDDSALAEYIILMLVNGKTQEQIATELSNDLLNLAPEDSGAADFAGWLFEQVNVLAGSSHSATGPTIEASQGPVVQAIPSFIGDASGRSSRQGNQQLAEARTQDAEMSEVVDGVQDGNIPTGPKSMRTSARPTGRRLMGQLSKAMDRTNDSVLHRVRPQSGERVNMHNRQPPRGPRASNGQNRPMSNAIPTGPSKGPGLSRPPPQGNAQLSPQQQMQLYGLLSQVLATGPPGMMPNAPTPVINPNFPRPAHHQGKSLFERVEGNPHRPNGTFNHNRQHQNGNAPNKRAQQDTEMGDDNPMDVESASKPSTEPSPDTLCKFNLKCTKSDCVFAHQSSAAPPGTAVDPTDSCPFGAACQNRKCTARHPSPAQRKTHQAEQDCRFWPNCSNPHCTFRHPSMPMCRNGADCTREGCRFTHVRTPCKFNPCLNAACVYKHEEGQKRGKFGDMVWKADGSAEGWEEREHVSERKFIAEDGPEELVVPERDGGHLSGSQESVDAEIIS